MIDNDGMIGCLFLSSHYKDDEEYIKISYKLSINDKMRFINKKR